MGKSKDTRRVEANQAMAVCHSIRTSPRKLNLVAQTIRGLNAEKAVAELSFSKLFVSEAFVGKGLVMKRMHARGRGRGARVLKPFSNLTVVVTERGE